MYLRVVMTFDTIIGISGGKMKRLFGVFVILNIITCPQNAMCDIMAELDALMKNNPVKEYCVGGNGKVQTIEKTVKRRVH